MAILRFTGPAFRDLDGISVHIGRENPQAASRLLARIEEKCRLLAGRPGIGRRQDSVLSGLRSHVVGRYVVFYRTIPDGIEVVRVLHGARDVDAAFGDDEG